MRVYQQFIHNLTTPQDGNHEDGNHEVLQGEYMRTQDGNQSLLHFIIPYIIIHTNMSIIYMLYLSMFIHIYQWMKIHKSQCPPRRCPQPTHTAGPPASTARVCFAEIRQRFMAVAGNRVGTDGTLGTGM